MNDFDDELVFMLRGFAVKNYLFSDCIKEKYVGIRRWTLYEDICDLNYIMCSEPVKICFEI